MMDLLKPYFNAIKSLDAAEATEHTLRGALETLLNAIAADENLNVAAIHEPKRDKTKLGAPDFKIKLNEAILGYLETKPIGENLDTVLKSDQIAKYKRLSGNLHPHRLSGVALAQRRSDYQPGNAVLLPAMQATTRHVSTRTRQEKVAKLIADFPVRPAGQAGQHQHPVPRPGCALS